MTSSLPRMANAPSPFECTKVTSPSDLTVSRLSPLLLVNVYSNGAVGPASDEMTISDKSRSPASTNSVGASTAATTTTGSTALSKRLKPAAISSFSVMLLTASTPGVQSSSPSCRFAITLFPSKKTPKTAPNKYRGCFFVFLSFFPSCA